MLPLALLLAGPIRGPGPGDPRVHAGRAGQTAVTPPRLDGAATIDGVLDEPQWRQAAVLTGFSEFTPVDGVAASDSTEVLLWYSSTALYIGIRAMDKSGAVHATLAARDQIFSDDNVQIYLSTFNDGRQATLFAVNPLGVQADGAVNENGSISCNGMSNCAAQTRQPPDLSPDFVWESKGRVTADGYEVEIRIPFRSVRFQQAKTQTWGLNVLRVVQRTGEEQTWTPARRASSSFLAQSGRLVGLTGLDAGHVLDLIPTVTSRVDYGPPAGSKDWQTTGGAPQIGGDLRYGLTHNLTLNATAHPDFSQVESDVPQFAFDPRQAIFYPEKRPFFLEGTEQFDAPFGMIYTRRIIQPVFASKLTGKAMGTQVGVLAAVDDQIGSNFGDNPVFVIARAARDLGPGSRVGLAWTEQHDGPEANRVGGADGRIVFDKVNTISYAGALAHDDDGTTTNDGGAWSLGYRLDGGHFRMNYGFSAISPDFITRSGFISQAGVGNAQLSNSYTWLWQHRAVQSLTFEVAPSAHWRYDDLVHGGPMQNRYLHFNLNARLQGGWNAGASYFQESFGYDPSIYTSYGLLHPDGSITPFTGGNDRLPNRDYVASVSTPTWRHFDLSVFTLVGLTDENYFEWARGRLITGSVQADYRPTDKLRFNLTYSHTQIFRPSDGSRVVTEIVPVFTAIYQLSRAVQLRIISQYALDDQDSLRDDSRTDLPIMIRHADGTYVRASAFTTGILQTNFLFTFLPNPGTVAYLGYGTVDQRPDLDGQPQLSPAQSSFFLKVSYLFRKQ
jgi:hypothetical protein